MAKVTGDRRHLARLRKLRSAGMQREVGKAIFAGANLISTEAQHLITEGSVSGRGHVPSLPGEPPNRGHVPSLPGEPPNRDTGLLDSRIETAKTGPMKAEVSSNAPYAAALEFGTSKMAERPYMQPATDKKRGDVTKLVRAAVKKIARGGVL